MLSFLLKDCTDCSSLEDAICRIDGVLAQYGKNSWQNISYMTNKPVPYLKIRQLVYYRQILYNLKFNIDFYCPEFTAQAIVSRIRGILGGEIPIQKRFTLPTYTTTTTTTTTTTSTTSTTTTSTSTSTTTTTSTSTTSTTSTSTSTSTTTTTSTSTTSTTSTSTTSTSSTTTSTTTGTTTSTTSTTTTSTTTFGPVDITSTLAGTTVTSVTPSFYTITSGSFPFGAGGGVHGHNNGFASSAISINITGTPMFPGNYSVYKNGILVQCINVNAPGTYSTFPFSSTHFDSITIALNLGSC